jgi:hypothetical protein
MKDIRVSAWKRLRKHVSSRMDAAKQYAFLPPIGSRARRFIFAETRRRFDLV